MQKNDVFEAEVVDLTYEGQGVVKLNEFPIFVDNALPGEKIIIRVTKVRRNFGFGRVEELLVRSNKRISAVNVNYLRTGIADLSHLLYDEQLLFKRKVVVDVLRKIAGKPNFPVLPVIEAEQVLRYRNKAQVPVRTVNGQLETGFFRKNSHDLIPIEDFYIQQPEIDRVIHFLRDQFRSSSLTAYDERTRQGLIRNIVVRQGYHTEEIMVILVLTSDKFPKKILSELVNAFPHIVSLQLNINHTTGNSMFGSTFKTLYGSNFITDKMHGKSFQISAQSFYQVNTAQAEKLYQVAYDFAGLKSTDIIIDAYSGIGTIGLCVADQVRQVYGMDVVPEAIKNAQQNAILNNVTNSHYEVGAAEEVFPRWISEGIHADVIFVDPPRKGLAETFIDAATATQARAIVYVSCNAATLSRDIVRFEDRGYKLDKVQPVDLFPQTHHVEVVVRLSKF